MFTGIIEATGTIRSTETRRGVLAVRVGCDRRALGLPMGGSIAVNGCCLTAVELSDEAFVCELTPETLARTAFGQRLKPGVVVNLERPMKADGRFDGHIVQGHVDGVGRLREMARLEATAEMTVEVGADLERYLVHKGSVAVDGISLTVAALVPGAFTVALIPYTLEHTNLAAARPGDTLNIEVDVIAKHVERLLALQHHF
ncbi:MAG: riboflavin synthase [Vicinamibacteria bacterium]